MHLKNLMVFCKFKLTHINLISLVIWASIQVHAFDVSVLKQDNCELSDEKHKEMSSSPEFKLKIKNLKSACDLKNYTHFNSDELYFFSKWGQKICKELMSLENQYSRQCKYGNLIAENKLNIAEAMAVAGYTAEYYNYLTPDSINTPATDAKKYKGFDIFNRVLISAVTKLNQYPEYQYNSVAYRGSSLHGKTYVESNVPFSFNRWLSSSCVEEKAFGPKLIDMSEEEKQQLIKDFGEETPIEEVEPFMFKRDPKAISNKLSTCQQTYYSENPTPPLTAESHFGNGNLSITILPPLNGKSKRVAIYELSDRREEAEVLFLPSIQFIVEKVIQPNDPSGDGIKTQVTLREVEK